MSVESNFLLVFRDYALWIVWHVINHATFSTNEKKEQNQSWLARTSFSALDSGYMYLRGVLVGLLRTLYVLWWARKITLYYDTSLKTSLIVYFVMVITIVPSPSLPNCTLGILIKLYVTYNNLLYLYFRFWLPICYIVTWRKSKYH